MASVDDRIVAMKFDNAAFQEKVASTIKSLDDLKKSLDFANAKKGMDDLTTSGRNFNLDSMSHAVEGLAGKFTAMGVVAFTVISNIASRAVDAGISIVKSLSLDQVLSGFHEYETNMNSIQTIMANTKADGSTLDDVNKALDTLNTYSDQTIYNFSQMAKNIGTFTAAGVDLDTSVGAIKGIANLAAISGSNADQASTAMYQLSQALASGSVKLMDWNSVVNAGMGGEVFQKALFETGKALGTIKDTKIDTTFDEWTKAGNTFRGSLEDGWITSEVLTNTLAGFTGDLTEAQIKAMGYTDEQVAQIMEMGKVGKDAATQIKTLSQLIGTVKESIGSGWTKSFQLVFGTFEEAKTLFTDINNSIGNFVSKSADARNAVLQSWKDLGGRTALIEGLKTAFSDIVNIIKPIKAAFRDIFPAATGQSLYDFTVRFKELMDRLTPSPAVVVLITRAFRGVFAAFSIGIDVVKGIFGFFHELFQLFTTEGDVNDGILGFAARLGDKIVNLKTILDRSNGIQDFFSNLAVTIKHLVTLASRYIDDFMTKVAEFIGNQDWLTGLFGGGDTSGGEKTYDLFGRLGDRFGWLISLGHLLAAAWDWISSKFGTISDKIGGFVSFLHDKFQNLPQTIADALSKSDYSTVLDTINVGLFGGFVLLVKRFIDHNPLSGLTGITDKIKLAIGGLTDTLGAMQAKLKSEALLNIAKAVALLTASLVVLSLIDSAALTVAMSAMAIGFGQLVTVMALLNKIVSGPTDAAKLALIGSGLVVVAGAILLMSVAAKLMSTMDWVEMAKGLTGVAGLLAIISLAVKPLSDNKGGMIATGLGLIAIAVALNILVLAVKAFAEMSWEGMAQGMVGVAAGLGIIAGAMQLMPNGANLALQGAGLLEISVALNILVLAIKSFAEMNWGQMAKGMAGLAGSLLIIALAMNLMPNGVNLTLQGAGLVLIGIGLKSIAKAVIMLSGMSWGELAKGLVALAGTLLVLAIAAAAMQGSIGGAIAIAILSISLEKLAKGLKEFSGVSWGDLLHGLAAIAAVMAVLGIGGVLIQPAIPALLGLGAALLLVGAGMALFGIGANLLASAFAIIATAGTEGVATLITVLDVLIQHLPAFIAAFADGFILLAQKILEALPGLIANLNLVVQALIQLLIDNIPGLIDAGVLLISKLLDAIVELFPKFVETGFQLLMSFLRGIRDHIPELVTTVVEIITSFLDTLTSKIPDLAAKGAELLVAFLKGISDHIQDVIDAGANILVNLLEGIANNISDVLTAAANIIIKLVEGIANNLFRIAVAAVDIVDKFLDTLSDNILRLIDMGWDFVINLINGIADSIDSHIDELRNAGIHLAGAIIDGMTFGLASKAGDVAKGALDVAKGAVSGVGHFLGIGSPSKLFIEIGGFMAQGMAIGLDQDSSAEASALAFSKRVTNTLQDALSKVPDAIIGMGEFTPTITPVLDLTNVMNGARQIGGILGTDPTLASNAAYNQAVLLAVSGGNQTDTTTDTTVTKPTEIKFEQNNYSPEALSTADIYRQTRSQINMAKEELAVP